MAVADDNPLCLINFALATSYKHHVRLTITISKQQIQTAWVFYAEKLRDQSWWLSRVGPNIVEFKLFFY